ncbi:GNAT family N-acetyltransferase [Tenacibaculum pacificus]|uniref:GNAT family N-acetyltransferase n=1 Tax=Tenacibaculum pacificus TaxID=3018314 RepID=UPI0022F3FF48|nr:GNAT family N-acetyltransferase [Tenacibaculum pacificus]WBX74342.1 GNAT family N-acetyltransferase [Tenacibaculum pacificus]
MITTRKATLEDLPILLEFEQGIIDFERPYDYTLKEDRISYYDIKEMILADDVEVIIAVDTTENTTINNQIIVGSGYARIEKAKPYLKHDTFVYLGFMFVAPTYRGKGINKLVIDALHTWAKSKNIFESRLEVYADNHGAIKAYQKTDFKSLIVRMRRSLL